MPFAVAAAGIGLVGSMMASDDADSRQKEQLDAQGRVADSQTQLGREQLDFSKRQYDEQKGMRDQIAQSQLDLGVSQQKAMDTQTGIAADYNAYNKSTFRPVEQAIVADAQGYDTPGRRAQAMDAASADVTHAYTDAAEGLRANLGRAGIAAGAGRSLALQNDNAIAQAATTAGATQAATNRIEDLGHARMVDAASLGRNLPANQATAAATAIQAGNAASTAGSAALTSGNSGVPVMNAGYAGAMAAGSSAGALYGSGAGAYGRIADANSSALGSFGNAVGKFGTTPYGQDMAGYVRNLFTPASGIDYVGGGGFTSAANTPIDYSGFDVSSEDVKSGTGAPIDPDKALSGIEKLSIDKGWKYDPSKGSPVNDGGQPHDGPMAADVQKNMGGTVSDGQAIDRVSMQAHQLAGMQSMLKRIKKLEKRAA